MFIDPFFPGTFIFRTVSDTVYLMYGGTSEFLCASSPLSLFRCPCFYRHSQLVCLLLTPCPSFAARRPCQFPILLSRPLLPPLLLPLGARQASGLQQRLRSLDRDLRKVLSCCCLVHPARLPRLFRRLCHMSSMPPCQAGSIVLSCYPNHHGGHCSALSRERGCRCTTRPSAAVAYYVGLW